MKTFKIIIINVIISLILTTFLIFFAGILKDDKILIAFAIWFLQILIWSTIALIIIYLIFKNCKYRKNEKENKKKNDFKNKK